MPISIYPPTLKSTQPAFVYSTSIYPIYFTLQQVTSFDEIGHVQIRIVRQSNNRTIVKTTKYPNGIIHLPAKDIKINRNDYNVNILSSDLTETWQPGCLYKIQMRFGLNPMFTSPSQFATWEQQQIDTNAFSEWSTVMVIKPISKPEVYIKNAEYVREDVISSERTESTLTPLFTGGYQIPAENKELVDKYKFDLYNAEGDLLETSGWVQHNGAVNSVDQHRFKTILINDNHYKVIYTIRTVNGYEQSADPYLFLASRTFLTEIENLVITIDDQDVFCKENGCTNIYLSSEIPLSGCFVITRSDEFSNFQVYEDLNYMLFSNRTLKNTLVYQDYTIESGIKYRYAIQQQNSEGLRSAPAYSSIGYHSVDFQHSYIYQGGVQLKLSLSNRITSFKHSTLSTKQDTLGDKYPHLTRNGNAYYAEFPIQGTISFQMDEDQTFFSLDNNGFSYKGELVIPRDKLREWDQERRPCAENVGTDQDTGAITNYNHLTINSDLTDNNIFVERKFREKVEEFLNDFNYKLFKSATEGNIIIGLMNVSLTPNATLGRMIYEFSATAYEVAENTLENLDELGIINIGKFQSLASDEIHLSFGQIKEIYNPTDIYSLIKNIEEISIGGGYMMRLERIRSIWIERCPEQDYHGELLELQAKYSELKNQGLEKEAEEVYKEIQRYNNLKEALKQPSNTQTTLEVNGTSILIQPNKLYSLKHYPINSLRLVATKVPIIINYVCELTQKEDLTVGVISAIDASRIWGQISGIFTFTDKILKVYNYNYKDSNTYRVYNGRPDKTVIYDSLGRKIVDNTNFNLYKTINLYNVVEEESRKQIEYIYGVRGGFYKDSNGQWTDGKIYYDFSNLILFDIEADPGTMLFLGRRSDGADARKVVIGPTCRYTLNPMDGLIRYISLVEPIYKKEERNDQGKITSSIEYKVPAPAHCIVNYKCLTNQMILKKER